MIGCDIPEDWVKPKEPAPSKRPGARWSRQQRRDHPRAEYARKLKSKYGLSEAEYWNLYCHQAGCCAICQRRVALSVDHDHRTGEVRGLLCGSCNRAIGLLKDDPDRAGRAAQYLEA